MLSLSPTNKIKEILLNSGPVVSSEQVSLNRDEPYLAYIKDRTNSMPLWRKHIYSSAMRRVCVNLSSSCPLPGRFSAASGVQLTNRRNVAMVSTSPHLRALEGRPSPSHCKLLDPALGFLRFPKHCFKTLDQGRFCLTSLDLFLIKWSYASGIGILNVCAYPKSGIILQWRGNRA